MARNKDLNWSCGVPPCSNDDAQLAVLMDIRDELKRLNSVMNCQNTLRIPGVLDQIAANTRKPKRKKKAVKK